MDDEKPKGMSGPAGSSETLSCAPSPSEGSRLRETPAPLQSKEPDSVKATSANDAVPTKKLSKLQLLAKQKAAMRAAKATEATIVTPVVASPGEQPIVEASRPSVEQNHSKLENDSTEEEALPDANFVMATPSSFASTVLGASESLKFRGDQCKYTHILADKTLKDVEKSFSKPSPDDVVKNAKAGGMVLL